MARVIEIAMPRADGPRWYIAYKPTMRHPGSICLPTRFLSESAARARLSELGWESWARVVKIDESTA